MSDTYIKSSFFKFFFIIFFSTLTLLLVDVQQASAQSACESMKQCYSSCSGSSCSRKCGAYAQECAKGSDRAVERYNTRRRTQGSDCTDLMGDCNKMCSGNNIMSCLQRCSDEAFVCTQNERQQRRSSPTRTTSRSNGYPKSNRSVVDSVPKARSTPPDAKVVGAKAMGDYYIELNPALALEWYEKGAKAGDGQSAYLAAKMYTENLHIAPNHTKHEQLLRIAVDSGNNSALTDYALLLHQTGRGPEADTYLKRAANLRYPDAQFLYAASFYYGNSNGINYEKAKVWLNKVNYSGLSDDYKSDYDSLAANLEKKLNLSANQKFEEIDSPSSINSDHAGSVSALGKARDCIETKRKYIYTRSNGVREYQYLLTNKCDVDVVVSFCQWEPPAKDHLLCDNDNNGKASFAQSVVVKSNLTTDAASVTGGMSAGACRETVSLNNKRYWLNSEGSGARVLKVGLSNGTSNGSYGCRYTPEKNGTQTTR